MAPGLKRPVKASSRVEFPAPPRVGHLPFMGMSNMASAVAALMLALLTATSALPMRHGAAEQLAEAEAAIDHMLADAALERRAHAEFTHSHEHGGGGGAAGVDDRVGGHEIDALAGGSLAGAALERSDELKFSCARASDGTCARPSRVRTPSCARDAQHVSAMTACVLALWF